ncbi:ATP-binding protein [Arenimonas alkanexedens]
MSALRSLRGRLLLASVAGIIAASFAAAWLLGASFERAALGAFDRRLADDLLTLAGTLERDGGGVKMVRAPADSRYERVFSGHYWQVGQGVEALRSRSMWDFSPAVADATRGGAVRYGKVSGPRGQVLRSAERWLRLPGVDGRVRVWVASDQAVLQREVEEFRWLAGVAVALLAAGLMLAAAAQVRYGLLPLRGLGRGLARVRSGESQRLDPLTLPTEVQPLVEHLNQLLEHHERMIERVRRSSQDMAHALKTPLAVLHAGVQRPGDDLPAVVADQLQRIRAVVERQLAAGTPVDMRRSSNVAAAVSRLQALMEAAYREKNLRWTVDVPATLSFRGADEDLEEMLGNLLDNACKWARSQVRVTAAMAPAGLRIEVRDDGPGLPIDQREAALQRGVRLDQRTPGTGLGLAIASEVAASYGGVLSLDAGPEGGLCSRLDLPFV